MPLPRTRSPRIIGAIVLAVLVVVLGAAAAIHHAHQLKPRRTVLADGTEALFYSDSLLEPAPGYPHPRALRVDGDLLLDVTGPDSAARADDGGTGAHTADSVASASRGGTGAEAANGTAVADPLIVRSRLLKLIVTGPSTLRIVARSHETGEQVEVLSGHVVAYKNYPSSYAEPDHLQAGEMSMVNQTIDLMEKEKFDPATLRVWIDELRRSTLAAK
jgi:hypothetical protein